MPAFPDQALEDPDNGEGQNDQQYELYDEIRGMKVEWHDHKIALLGACIKRDDRAGGGALGAL